MKTDKITVADLFEKQRRYLVPLFQRGYVWTLSGQLKPLWRDVLEQVEHQRQTVQQGRKHPRKHFLGAVVLHEVNPGVRHVPISEVIDGQQRLTTLQVMLIALRDVVESLENQFLSARLRRLTENEGPYPHEAERFKVWPTSAFREEFQAIATAKSVNEVRKRFPLQRVRRKWLPRPLLVQGYLFFYEAITRHLTGQDIDLSASDDEGLDILDLIVFEITANKLALARNPEGTLSIERAELLLETVIEHVQLVEINLDSEDDPQIIFETLNARGAPLQPSDLIRNYVFLYATRQGDDVNTLYDNGWKDFDEAPALMPRSETNRFWKDSERQGRLRSSRIDLLLYHYVTLRTGNDIKIGHIFQEFRDWWESGSVDRNAATELSRLRNAASIFRSLVAPDIRTRFGLFAYRLKTLDTTTVYPLILLLKECGDQINLEELDGMLLDIESYLVRRAICGLTPKNYNRVFLGLVNSMREARAYPSRERLQALLLDMSGDSVVWPNDELLERQFVYEPIYKQLRPGRTRMVLEGVEAAMHSSKQEFFPFEDPLLKPLTIEHVMPQWGKEDDWPKPVPETDGTPDFVALQRREMLLHSIGNLTLLTQPLNSSVSNGPFRIKRKEIALQSRLTLNSYFQELSENDAWDEEAIINRGRTLFQLARKAWPFPTMPAVGERR